MRFHCSRTPGNRRLRAFVGFYQGISTTYEGAAKRLRSPFARLSAPHRHFALVIIARALVAATTAPAQQTTTVVRDAMGREVATTTRERGGSIVVRDRMGREVGTVTRRPRM
jgi:hypothetical protein